MIRTIMIHVIMIWHYTHGMLVRQGSDVCAQQFWRRTAQCWSERGGQTLSNFGQQRTDSIRRQPGES